jgi:hypothetical protein
LAKSFELGVPTQNQVDAVTRLQSALAGLGQAAHQAGVNLLSDVSPALTTISDDLAKQIGQHPDVSEAVLALSSAMTALGAVRISASLMGLSGVVAAIDALIAAFAIAIPLAGGAYSTYKSGQDETFAQDTAAKQGYTEPVGSMLEDGSFPAYRNPTTGDTKSWTQFLPRSNPLSPSYDGSGGGSGANPPAAGTPAYDVMEKTRAFWLSKGFTPDQVAGILAGGPAAESGFDPNKFGDNGTSYGLYQEHAERMAALFGKFGPNPSVEQQNQFAWEELQGRPDVLARLRGAGSSADATRAWTEGFEIPRNTGAAAAARAATSGSFLPRAPLHIILPQQIRPGSAAPGGGDNNTYPNITIGSVTINTKATDVKGIARDFASAAHAAWLVQANRGLA